MCRVAVSRTRKNTDLPHLHDKVHVIHPLGCRSWFKTETERSEKREDQVGTGGCCHGDKISDQSIADGASEREEQLEDHWVVGSEE